MKIQLLSDTHSNLDRFKINKEADLIIHAGDFTNKLDGINQIVKLLTACLNNSLKDLSEKNLELENEVNLLKSDRVI